MTIQRNDLTTMYAKEIDMKIPNKLSIQDFSENPHPVP